MQQAETSAAVMGVDEACSDLLHNIVNSTGLSSDLA
jgi:hypothetical protein